jgi:hypothetical protein
MIAAPANATPTATGFFVEINGDKAYASISEYFRNEGENSSQQSLFFKGSANAWSVGLGLGWGKELVCNFYAGGSAFFKYNTADIALDEKDPGKTVHFVPNGGEGNTYGLSPCAMSIKPMFSFGGSVLLGYKAIPNLLVCLSLGCEWTQFFINQSFLGLESVGNGYFNVMGFSQGASISKIVEVDGEKDGKPEKVPMSITLINNGELKATIMHFLPGIVVRYYLLKNVYAGADASLSIGMNKLLNAQCFLKSGTYVVGEAQSREMYSVDKLKSTPYAKGFGFRIGVSVGLTF